MGAPAWFETWFDSPYYPILYQNRDQSEARLFIRNLTAFLKPLSSAQFLDLGCGRGRHSVYLHSLGFQVTGMDLSKESIKEAKAEEKPGLHFQVGDMRDPFPGKYDYILNLFTSFGYFKEEETHLSVLKNTVSHLNPGGTFVLDFFNSVPLLTGFPKTEVIERDGIMFHILKEFADGYITKKITVNDLLFEEQVRAFTPDELRALIKNAGMEVIKEWGSYEGRDFDIEKSPRLILFCKVPVE